MKKSDYFTLDDLSHGIIKHKKKVRKGIPKLGNRTPKAEGQEIIGIKDVERNFKMNGLNKSDLRLVKGLPEPDIEKGEKSRETGVSACFTGVNPKCSKCLKRCKQVKSTKIITCPNYQQKAEWIKDINPEEYISEVRGR